jgi:hypothetical protein
MENRDNIRDRILSRMPQPANVAAYRDEMASTLAKNEQRLRLGKWVAAAYWLLAVGLFADCVSHNQYWLDTPRGHISAFTTIMLLITGAVQLLRFAVNKGRVEILKEIKQLQLQVLELRAAMEKSGNTPGL